MRQKRVHLRRDPNSLVASASIMTGPRRTSDKMDTQEWQAAAWDYYDQIGELRFGVNWLANALSRVNLVAAIPPNSQGDEPSPVDLAVSPGLARQVQLVTEIAGGSAGQGQLLAGSAKHLTVPGLGYILATADETTDTFASWRALSNDEVHKRGGDVIEVANPETGEFAELAEADLLIKVWRAHPRRSWMPDSPVRAVLDSLNEISLLTKRIAADARSRLAGNGLLVIPEEAEFPPGQVVVNANGTTTEQPDEFIATFVQVAQVAIADQDSPAAKVPLVIRMPGEFVKDVQHLTFWSDFDAALDTLRQAAVKRLALGLDMPPEVLLGMGDSNHWSAWQIAEEAITLHIEPLAETICHALTVGFLRPALEDEGLDPDSVIVWYDTTDLTTRPDRTAAASEAHSRRKISDAAYLREIGLDDADSPEPTELRTRILVDLAMTNPTIAPALLMLAGIFTDADLEATDTGVGAPAAPAAMPAPTPPADGPPARDTTPPAEDTAPPDGQAAAAAGLLGAADGLVVRALERAGARLRSAAGKSTAGGAAAISCPDPATLHTQIAATEFASLDHLLNGAWDRLPVVAERWGVDVESLTACLDGYARALLASGHAHDYDRLAVALGVPDEVADRRLIATH